MTVEPIRCADMTLLHPLAARAFNNLEGELRGRYLRGEIPFLFRPFETYRHPSRQAYVKAKGASQADAYKSPHQFGLAVDFVPWDEKKGWHWDVVPLWWSSLKGIARTHGLDAPISWDKAHIEHPLWKRTRLALWGEQLND